MVYILYQKSTSMHGPELWIGLLAALGSEPYIGALMELLMTF